MQQILSPFLGLSLQKQIVVVGATLAMFALVLSMARMAAAPTMSLLYANLEPTAAGEVVTALEQRSAVYEVRGTSIFVEANRRDELRMTLAGEGKPALGAQGYELLDNLSGFGTTSQMFDAAYWRAKEGELARTIVASPLIQSARVHISNANAQPFVRNTAQTASVTVSSAAGSLTASQAKALRYLVASAVSGLLPENVSVIDSRGGLILGGEEAEMSAGTSGADRSEELKRNVERLLEARVGYGNAVVEVNVDTLTDREQITERTFDPDSRVAISTETEERSTSSTDQRGGAVTVASNLPDGDAGGSDQTSSSENTETRERVNFEVSETQREILRSPGAIRRISVAVLIDGIRTTDDAGAEIWEARSEAEMAQLRELVSSAVGFDEARGDTITLQSMEFEPLVEPGAAVTSPSLLSSMAFDVMSLIQLAVLALVSLVLGFFVVRPIMMAPPRTTLPALAPPPARQEVNALPELGSSLPPLDGEISSGGFPSMAIADIDFDGSGAGGSGAGDGDPVERLRNLIDQRQSETVEVLRGWLEAREERA